MDIVKINKLNGLKSLNEIQKLSLKSTQLSTEQGRAHSSRSWSLNVNKFRDCNLRLLRFRGYISTATQSTTGTIYIGHLLPNNYDSREYKQGFPRTVIELVCIDKI